MPISFTPTATPRVWGPRWPVGGTQLNPIHIPKDVHVRVLTEVARCLQVATNRYGPKFRDVYVTYKLRGTTAGKAEHTQKRSTVLINAALLLENQEEMIKDTVPHEVAHIIDFILHPDNFVQKKHVNRYGRVVKQEKRSIHGNTWKSVMRVLGVEPERTHDMDVSNVRTRQNRHYRYKCPGCLNSIILVGPKNHKIMQARGRRLIIKKCRHSVSAANYLGENSLAMQQ